MNSSHKNSIKDAGSQNSMFIVLGDQLNHFSELYQNLDPQKVLVWMAEVLEEASHVPSYRQRIALFFSAMRHYRDNKASEGFKVCYSTFRDNQSQSIKSLGEALQRDLKVFKPATVQWVYPGEHRVYIQLEKVLSQFEKESRAKIVLHEDPSFLCSRKEFLEFAKDKKSLRMEFFYREMRKKHGILMEADQTPVGGRWNFDADNRKPFNKSGPENLQRLKLSRDSVTEEILKEVSEDFQGHLGELNDWNWPVDRKQALEALQFFLKHHLKEFGSFQDAMWTDEPFLHHALISSSLNLKLLSPLEVIQKALKAYEKGAAPLSAVEGFIRQILGWREFIRGIYDSQMPKYAEKNFLKAQEPLPHFYWTAQTTFECLRQALGQTLRYGYAHHIQRLMVTGLFSLLLGVDPQAIHEWYLSVYVDAVEWVELPNVLGMSQYADGGFLGSKPYIASGQYIDRMSNYCSRCPKNPKLAFGENACPFTTLYWDFVQKHQTLLQKNPRTGQQVKNWNRFDAAKQKAILKEAVSLRKRLRTQRS